MPRGPSPGYSRQRRSIGRHGGADAVPADKERSSSIPHTNTSVAMPDKLGEIVDLTSFGEVVNDDGEEHQILTRFLSDDDAAKDKTVEVEDAEGDIFEHRSGHSELQQRQC
jgi:hypothetical protein